MSDEKQGTVVFGKPELDPKEAAEYQQKIANARKGGSAAPLKGSTPLGHVPKAQGVPLLTREPRAGASPFSETGGVQPRPPGSPILRPETVQELQEAAEAQVKVEEKKQEITEAKDDIFEMFDFNGRNEAERILNNKKRRKEIESRLEPMKLEDLIMKDEVVQDVPIVPGQFTVRFRSATPVESLFTKRLMADEKVTSDQYLMEKYSIYLLTCSLVSINGVALPSHMNEKGEPEEDLFMKKLRMVMKKSGYVVADLGINFYWFDLRVRQLLNPEDLKNG